jgi:hypothetical protein
MPALNLTERFDTFNDNLKLDPAERERAVAGHNRIGDLLVEAGVARRTRLQGSFARKTMLPPLHDIDKVVELDDDLEDVLTEPGGPEKAMSLIRDTLQPRLPGARFEIKKHALGIDLPGEGFTFDAVPAFNPDDGTNWIDIADTEDQAWERSNTYQLIDTVADRNQVCDGRFVRQVRMVKQAVRTAGLADVLPGLHVETFVYEAITTTMAHPDAVSAALATAASLLGGPYRDPTGVDRISDRLDPAAVITAKASMRRLADQAAEAQRLAAGDETAAARIWADIFGDPFPAPVPNEKGFLTRLHGGAGLGPTGATSAARPTPRTRAWRPA